MGGEDHRLFLLRFPDIYIVRGEGVLPSFAVALLPVIITTVQFPLPLVLTLSHQRTLGATNQARDTAVVVVAHDALNPTTPTHLTGDRRVAVGGWGVRVRGIETVA